MNLQSLDYVILLCEDLASMKAFYHGVLGFPMQRDGEGWIELRAGPVLLTLRPRGRAYDGPTIRGSAGVQLAFRVEPPEVERWHRELLQKQVEILEPPRDREYGHRTLFFKDPEGNVLEIYAEI
jgi:catechol 2,3-dioxygenase-like lactoylglutathione lyase family enzyme